MNRFLQLHLLTSYPPANLNRDDLGRPKTAIMGGATRLRISSQSLKRAWRKSDLFAEAVKGHVGVRTKEMGRMTFKRLVGKGVAEKKARAWASKIAGQFGKHQSLKKDDPDRDLLIEQLAHFSPEEVTAIESLADLLAERDSDPTDEELQLLREKPAAADIALFGRMLAASRVHNVEAAAQVAHAITVHKVAVENDFFTAVDDLNTVEDEAGAGHMGETEFGAGLFYLYICIDRQMLAENLRDDQGLLRKTLAALVEATAKVAPTGKQNSFASRAHASWIMSETGNQQPRSLSVAFLNPVSGRKKGFLTESIEQLENVTQNMDRAYGACSDQRATMNVSAGVGTLDDIIRCATE